MSGPPARGGPRVVAIVPARDEEATVGRTVKELLALGVDQVVVAAGACADRTVEEAAAAGARVLASARVRGKGRAVEAALDLVPDADVYLLVDADVGETAPGVEPVLRAVLDGDLDLAVGRFPALGGGGFGLVRRLAGLLVQRLGGVRLASPLSGQRAVTREALWACRPLDPGFGMETGMSIDAGRLGLRVREVPVDMRHRPTGRGPRGFAHRARQGLAVVAAAAPRALGLR